jgi:hypothetical protein
MSIPPLVLCKFTFLIYQNFTLRLFTNNSLSPAEFPGVPAQSGSGGQKADQN